MIRPGCRLAAPARLILKSPSKAQGSSIRSFSRSSTTQQNCNPATTANPRWLSDLKLRIGKCVQFGMNEQQTTHAGLLLAEVARDWRALLAGSEGYLVDKRRAGITSVPINWGDQDAMGHVNNVQYVRFCETGRTNWTRKIGDYFDPQNKKIWDEMLTSKSFGLILKSIKVDYKFPMTWPDTISVYHKIRVLPTAKDSSMLLDVLILSEGKQRAAARAEEDVVVYDYKAGKKSTLPDYMLKQFQAQFQEQEAAKRHNSSRLQEILLQVRQLEQETWDRIDAKEDVGGAP